MRQGACHFRPDCMENEASFWDTLVLLLLTLSSQPPPCGACDCTCCARACRGSVLKKVSVRAMTWPEMPSSFAHLPLAVHMRMCFPSLAPPFPLPPFGLAHSTVRIKLPDGTVLTKCLPRTANLAELASLVLQDVVGLYWGSTCQDAAADTRQLPLGVAPDGRLLGNPRGFVRTCRILDADPDGQCPQSLAGATFAIPIPRCTLMDCTVTLLDAGLSLTPASPPPNSAPPGEMSVSAGALRG